jgi:hypothetical protein
MNPLIQFRTTIPPLLVSVLFVCFAVPAAHSATELFSANLSGENEVPPINTAGSATFRMEVGEHDHLFVNLLRAVIAPCRGPPALRTEPDSL